jgi:hypothetical protein
MAPKRVMADEPQFTHDCKACVFLGGYDNKEGHHDLYICPDSPWHTVLARYGNEGSEYRSFAVDFNVQELFHLRADYVLTKAYEAALAAGYTFGAEDV